MSEKRSIPCPICRKQVTLGDPESPFCSERCRLIDLGNWATEAYRIPEPLEDFEIEELPRQEERHRDE